MRTQNPRSLRPDDLREAGSGTVLGRAWRKRRLFLFLAVVLASSRPVGVAAPEEEASKARSAVPARSSGWSQWRGPNRDGISPEKGLLERWPPEGPRLLWETAGVGDGYSSLSCGDGRVLTQGVQEGLEQIHALELSTGKLLWSAPLGPAHTQDYSGSRSTPTVDGERVHALSGAGVLTSIELASGKALWSVNLLERFKASIPGWAISESVLVVDGRVICSPGGPDAAVVALDRATGATMWASSGASDGAGYSSPILVEAAGVRQIVTLTSKGLLGVAVDGGKFLWRYERMANGIANIATPVAHEGAIFASTAYDTGCALLRLEPAGARSVRAREVYFSRDLKNHHGGFVLVNGTIYGFHNDRLRALDWSTGRVRWTARSVGKGAVIAAEGRLYLFSEDGVLALAEVNPSAYVELSRLEVEHGKTHSWAHPAIEAGRLLIRTQNKVRAYDLRPGAGQ